MSDWTALWGLKILQLWLLPWNNARVREYEKFLEYRLHPRLSKFDWSVFLVLKQVSFFCPLYGVVFFYQETIGVR